MEPILVYIRDLVFARQTKTNLYPPLFYIHSFTSPSVWVRLPGRTEAGFASRFQAKGVIVETRRRLVYRSARETVRRWDSLPPSKICNSFACRIRRSRGKRCR